MPGMIDAVPYKVDVKVQRLAQMLDLEQLASARRKGEVADAKDFFLAGDCEDDDEFHRGHGNALDKGD